MPEQTIPARDRALKHLQAALDTGVRGELRNVIRRAINIASGHRVSDVTDLEYRQLAVGAKLVDPARPGLLMRHGIKTGKVWVYRFDHPQSHKQVELQFGRYPQLETAEARGVWRGMRDQRRDGKVPSVARESSDTGGGSTLTVGDLVRRFLVEYVRTVKAASSAREDERLLAKHVLPHYAELPAVEFDHARAKAVLSNLHRSGAPREAEKLRSVLSTMFNVAAGKTRKISTLDGSWLPSDHKNPVEAVMLPRRAPKRHNPSRAELQAYVRGLSRLGVYGDVLRTQIETFARISEITGMRWDELDLDAATWTLPASRSKNGRAHVVMLAIQTVARLHELRGLSISAFVFPARTDPGVPLSSSQTIQVLAANRAKLDVGAAFTSHATRHAALTWVAESGGGRDIRDRLSNHTPPKDGADHVYVAAEHNGAAREWTQRWVDHLAALASDNVVSLGEARA
jgi:integrase